MRVVRHYKFVGSDVDAVCEPYIGEHEAHGIALLMDRITSQMRRNDNNSLPDHSAGRNKERRAYARVRLSLPLRVQRVAGQRDADTRPLRTQDISSSGAYFLLPRGIEPGTPIELELVVVDRPLGPGSVRMCAEAHVVRAAKVAQSGWHGVAVAFDDIRFFRDDPVPPRSHAE